MKVTFFSNFLNHHQLPFCEEMQSRLGNEFKFVANTPVDKERINLGYSDMNKQYDFVLTTYDSDVNEKIAMHLAIESDVIIHGSAPEKYVSQRMKFNKLTFRYSERIYKRGLCRYFSPRGFCSLIKRHTIYRNKELYMLCASAYTSGDLSLIGAYTNKCFKWGYFPRVNKYDIDNLLSQKRSFKINILWCGRFLDWKHPEYVVYLANYLKTNGLSFHINMIGIGELEDFIKSELESYGLKDEVSMIGSVPHEQVRRYMEMSNIFLFTSDYNEGWGAVINESMNSGCAVVASHACGSVPFLIKNGKNGLIYKSGDVKDICLKVERLVLDEQYREELGKKAYFSMIETWNAKTAADKIVSLSSSLLEGKKNLPKDGPCSIALPMKQWDMYRACAKGI